MRLCEHAHAAAIDAEDLIATGDHQRGGIRLLEAAELYWLAAHQLNRDMSPTGRH